MTKTEEFMAQFTGLEAQANETLAKLGLRRTNVHELPLSRQVFKTFEPTDDRVEDFAVFVKWAKEMDLTAEDEALIHKAAFSDLSPNQVENARHRAG